MCFCFSIPILLATFFDYLFLIYCTRMSLSVMYEFSNRVETNSHKNTTATRRKKIATAAANENLTKKKSHCLIYSMQHLAEFWLRVCLAAGNTSLCINSLSHHIHSCERMKNKGRKKKLFTKNDV